MLDVGASQFPFKQNDLQFDTESKGPLYLTKKWEFEIDSKMIWVPTSDGL